MSLALEQRIYQNIRRGPFIWIVGKTLILHDSNPLLISCEHAGTALPACSQDAFPVDGWSRRRLVDQSKHQGALSAAHLISKITSARLYNCSVARAVIDVNRSKHHRELFGQRLRTAPATVKEDILQTVYDPYRQQLRSKLAAIIEQHSFVIHVAVRTFPPFRKKAPRRADVGLVYDTNSANEIDLCLDWYDELFDRVHWIRVRRNYPVRGRRDTMMKCFRRYFGTDRYIGVELFLNEAWTRRRTLLRDQTFVGLGMTLQTVTSFAGSNAEAA